MINLTGQVFGRLTVIEMTPERRSRSPVYLCQCECGNKHLVAANNLRRNLIRSCGCLRREASRERVTAYNAVRDANL